MYAKRCWNSLKVSSNYFSLSLLTYTYLIFCTLIIFDSSILFLVLKYYTWRWPYRSKLLKILYFHNFIYYRFVIPLYSSNILATFVKIFLHLHVQNYKRYRFISTIKHNPGKWDCFYIILLSFSLSFVWHPWTAIFLLL